VYHRAHDAPQPGQVGVDEADVQFVAQHRSRVRADHGRVVTYKRKPVIEDGP